MGRDKALIEIDGRTMLEGAVQALEDAGVSPVVVVGGDGDTIGALGLTAVPDLHPGEGPLGGLLTAFEAVESPTLMLLSCDLTEASSIAVTTVIGALGDADVSVPVVDGREQWLHTAWRRRAVLSLAEAFDAGARSIQAGAERLRISRILDGDPCWYHDADRPDDLPSRRRR